ncbi:hypothetical protein [Streptomyces sp. NBC_01443]|uniref:hypothetical protein n=1 Tax=Streptomyces sp. NBC_01443 TaxID=2903868 RepID=UPI00224F34C1|nr:hypothetical protein [Streptomyces sp. NBC_01443]MCX4625501.1 hypothetical protein [Streptomyces sp. NBC_01443]
MRYHPEAHFWPLQMVEGGIVLMQGGCDAVVVTRRGAASASGPREAVRPTV